MDRYILDCNMFIPTFYGDKWLCMLILSAQVHMNERLKYIKM